MTKANRIPALIILLLCCLPAFTWAQSGDQILDGIGETDLIARYRLDKDAKDWSRNNLHAQLKGHGTSFVKDETFSSVLALSGEKGAFVSIPPETLRGLESMSISCWVFLMENAPGQLLFNIGSETENRLLMAPSGTEDGKTALALLTTPSGKKYVLEGKPLETGKWHHLTLVLDIPDKVARYYLNGEKTAEITAPLDLTSLFESTPSPSFVTIGKPASPDDPYLKAKLHDFRIYRTPLTAGQVANIHRNALQGEGESRVNEQKQPEDDLQVFAEGHPQLYSEYLTGVDDVQVATETGHLPRLPRYVNGTYRDGINGPKVRVIWPAPKDNHQVQEPGKYTVKGKIAGSSIVPVATVTIKEKVDEAVPEQSLEAFGLDAVSLETDIHGHSSKFIENRDKFISTLAGTNPDDFLYMFRNAFGQEQPAGAVPLGVWDSQETKLRGHATGHYLTAIAQAYASTGYDTALQANFADKMAYMVNTLYNLSQMAGKPSAEADGHNADPTAVPMGPGKDFYDSDLSEEGIRTDYWNWGEGYISAYPPDQFIMLEHGAKYGGQKDQVWAPYYTLHKILAGLMDIYEVSGNEKALSVAKGMGTWVAARLDKLPTSTLISMWNTYIAGEFGGMNEAMARLYRITGSSRYLAAAKLFDNITVFYGNADHDHGLAKNVDTFRGLHANQHIPQIMGALEMYRDTESAPYFHIADNFWHIATNDYMYSIGGVAGARTPANAECFTTEPATLYEFGFSAGGQNETCATYNMLKLSRNLFLFQQDPAYMDYYERGLYNHILASVAKDSPANTYHVPLRPGSIKQFGNPKMKGFTCCNGTAIESSTKLQNSIYFKSVDDQSLYVNLFVPSTLHWKERNLTIVQSTAFPKEDHTRLTVQGKGKFVLKIRVPQWATEGIKVSINGKPAQVDAVPGTYATIQRKWKNGDTIDINIPFQFHLEPVMDQQNIASLFYGPVLLAAQEEEPRKEWRKVTLNAKNIGATINGNPEALEFTIDGVTYKPFYETYGRHSVYLDVTLED
ncbi:beta-L-arabinofuranosidase domain-containing protein [Echinicola vietnamensis]|nr:beta-L-arabinofuranosidase domain-containing protein [Echinicola vietnamensis]